MCTGVHHDARDRALVVRLVVLATGIHYSLSLKMLMHGRAYADTRACMHIFWPCMGRAHGRASGETQAHGRAILAHGRASGSSTEHRSENAQMANQITFIHNHTSNTR